MDAALGESAALRQPAEHQPLRCVEADARGNREPAHWARQVVLLLKGVTHERARVDQAKCVTYLVSSRLPHRRGGQSARRLFEGVMSAGRHFRVPLSQALTRYDGYVSSGLCVRKAQSRTTRTCSDGLSIHIRRPFCSACPANQQEVLPGRMNSTTS